MISFFENNTIARDWCKLIIYRLNIPRYGHATGIAGDSQLYIFGGTTVSFFGKIKAVLDKPMYVEALDVSSSKCVKHGELRHPMSDKLACCSTEDGSYFLVCGAQDLDNNNFIQVYDIHKKVTTRTISFACSTTGHMYNAIRVKEYFVAIGSNYVAVCKIQDILAGKDDSLHLCKNYEVPNTWCVATESPDGQDILLLGGVPKEGKPLHFVYQAKIDDIVQDTEAGWQPSDIPWKLGGCRLYGGCATATVVIED